MGTDNATIRWHFLPPLYFLNLTNECWWGCCLPPRLGFLSTLLRGSHIRMALFPGTPKEESQNCLELNSRDFGHSYLLAPTSD
jgi:hypothetical protein